MTLADRLKGIKRGGGVPVGDGKYFPMSNTSINPVYANTGNTGQSINGQTYTFIPNDGIYFDDVATDFYQLFRATTLVAEPNMLIWDTINIVNMNQMFFGSATFNQDISSWDTSNTSLMTQMFKDAISFNQDLSSWCVSLILTRPPQFDTGATSWVLPRPIWGTCPA